MAPGDLDRAVREAAEALGRATCVAVLTGAGVSAESGVPTFRASDGLWEGHRVEDVASPDGFRRDPKLVWQFYNGRRANVARVRPNAGHAALADLERRLRDGFTLVTQNVDGLHQEAGNQNVLEIHGSLRRTRCTECGAVRDRGLDALAEMPTCELCGGLLRPDRGLGAGRRGRRGVRRLPRGRDECRGPSGGGSDQPGPPPVRLARDRRAGEGD
jgi:NAD-dependent protein deacetylase/lipoamidase